MDILDLQVGNDLLEFTQPLTALLRNPQWVSESWMKKKSWQAFPAFAAALARPLRPET
jgi:hypothetical protein